jgi:hypothetical protein
LGVGGVFRGIGSVPFSVNLSPANHAPGKLTNLPDTRKVWPDILTLEDLRARFETFAFDLHPEKTRLTAFGRFAQTNQRRGGSGRGEAFDFLGFTHICARTRDGRFQLRHQGIAEQGQWLKSVVAGYHAYHAVPTNQRTFSAFRYHVVQTWLRSLKRRSQRHKIPRDRMAWIIDIWVPKLVVKHPRQEPSALAVYALDLCGARGNPRPYRD